MVAIFPFSVFNFEFHFMQLLLNIGVLDAAMALVFFALIVGANGLLHTLFRAECFGRCFIQLKGGALELFFAFAMLVVKIIKVVARFVCIIHLLSTKWFDGLSLSYTTARRKLYIPVHNLLITTFSSLNYFCHNMWLTCCRILRSLPFIYASRRLFVSTPQPVLKSLKFIKEVSHAHP